MSGKMQFLFTKPVTNNATRRLIMKKQRILLSLVSLIMVSILLFGCSSSNNGDNSKKQENEFPTKEITLIIPWAAGGSTDTVCRKLASLMEEELGQTIVVKNVEGAGGSVGFSQVAGAKADGYTICAMAGTMIFNQYFKEGVLPYDSVYNLAIFNTNPSCIAVPADSEFETLEDILAYAKSHPGEVRISNSGIGGTWHVAATYLEQTADVEFNHIPYEGGNPAVTAAAGGHVEAVCCAVSEANSLVSAGELKYIAVSGDERNALCPDVLTFAEQGIDGMFGSYVGMCAPKETPTEIADVLISAMKNAIESDDMIQFMSDGGYDITWISGKELDTYMKELDASTKEMFGNK